MKKFIKVSMLGLLFFAGTFVLSGLVTSPIASAQEEVENTSNTEQTNTEEAVYKYVAQPGDSYTKISRKAVQTYGAIKSVNLTQAQIVAAETFLTTEAGSPQLNVGQNVEMKESVVEAAVKKAQALSEQQLKLWQIYALKVDFNTDKVGQA